MLWIGWPRRLTGMEWNPIAFERPRANRIMYCMLTEPDPENLDVLYTVYVP